ncbi:hypothetical protein EX30DRAFT_392059 [Ascodesmis nigricans]|uniref:Altered inheritance of mitochondria protein 11 n=1 Tax=Ascodesmis nigricans TaxID=341454 RepID=A0A4S2N5W2_9PEZI|nr:hypothetical protein EX30DRAFT_392059 [Ascodesmis nigricans]
MGLTSWLWGSDSAASASADTPSSSSITPPPAPPASVPVQSVSATSAPTPLAPPKETETQRMLRQLTLPLFGTTFLLLSISLTRRSLRRRFAPPPFYHQSNAPPITPPSGALDAFEALQLATLNVMSMTMIMVGAGAFMLDVCSVKELRDLVQAKMNEGGPEALNARTKAEEEFEEWMVEILARKEVKEKAKSIAEQAMQKR